MRKAFIITFIAVVVMMSGCARITNRWKSNGTVFGSVKGNWIVIKQSGGKITDVWKLEDQFVQSEETSDGWLFIDQNENAVHVGGDMKAIRISGNKQAVFNSYVEYHMEHDSLDYYQRYMRSRNFQ